MQRNSTGVYVLETRLKSVTYRIEGLNEYFLICRQHFKSVNLTRKVWYAANVSFTMCQVDRVFVISYENGNSYISKKVDNVSCFLQSLRERHFTEFARIFYLAKTQVSTYENSEILVYLNFHNYISTYVVKLSKRQIFGFDLICNTVTVIGIFEQYGSYT